MIREHDGSTTANPPTSELTWDQAVERHGHDCAVIWDRDHGAADWVPVLREREGISERVDRGDHYEIVVRVGRELWADDADCIDRMRRLGKLACRCHRWDRGARLWLPRIDQSHDFRLRLADMETTRSTMRTIELNLQSQVKYAGALEHGSSARAGRRGAPGRRRARGPR